MPENEDALAAPKPTFSKQQRALGFAAPGPTRQQIGVASPVATDRIVDCRGPTSRHWLMWPSSIHVPPAAGACACEHDRIQHRK
jgi:hypothetical protein